jgi:nitroreductase
VPALDLASVDHLLTTTRAVRRRLDLDRPVPRDVLVECLRLAIQAPTGSNAQLWRWVVVTDPEKRRAIAELYRAGIGMGQARYASDETPPPPADSPQQRRVVDSSMYLADHLQEVPVHVIPCMPATAGTSAGWAPSIYPAAWSFMLALRSRGLGSCITTLHLFHARETAELLGIPDGIAQAALIPVAYFTGDDFRPAARRPVEELTYWDEWGNVDG